MNHSPTQSATQADSGDDQLRAAARAIATATDMSYAKILQGLRDCDPAVFDPVGGILKFDLNSLVAALHTNQLAVDAATGLLCEETVTLVRLCNLDYQPATASVRPFVGGSPETVTLDAGLPIGSALQHATNVLFDRHQPDGSDGKVALRNRIDAARRALLQLLADEATAAVADHHQLPSETVLQFKFDTAGAGVSDVLFEPGGCLKVEAALGGGSPTVLDTINIPEAGSHEFAELVADYGPVAATTD